MAESQNGDDTQTEDKVAHNSTPFLLVGTIADTTWRMFVPAIGFTMLGVKLDEQYGTKPWLMFAGIIVGSVMAFLLVKKQINNIRSGTK